MLGQKKIKTIPIYPMLVGYKKLPAKGKIILEYNYKAKQNTYFAPIPLLISAMVFFLPDLIQAVISSLLK